MAKTVHASNVEKVAGDMFGTRILKLEGLASSIHKSLLSKIEALEKRVADLENPPSDVIEVIDIVEEDK